MRCLLSIIAFSEEYTFLSPPFFRGYFSDIFHCTTGQPLFTPSDTLLLKISLLYLASCSFLFDISLLFFLHTLLQAISSPILRFHTSDTFLLRFHLSFLSISCFLHFFFIFFKISLGHRNISLLTLLNISFSPLRINSQMRLGRLLHYRLRLPIASEMASHFILAFFIDIFASVSSPFHYFHISAFIFFLRQYCHISLIFISFGLFLLFEE